ncbi:MAG: hypothetical protein AMXMBFR64_57460 [Myxococcales bacterium]
MDSPRRHTWRIVRLLGGNVQCLRLTKDGHPWHPLYVPRATTLRGYP